MKRKRTNQENIAVSTSDTAYSPSRALMFKIAKFALDNENVIYPIRVASFYLGLIACCCSTMISRDSGLHILCGVIWLIALAVAALAFVICIFINETMETKLHIIDSFAPFVCMSVGPFIAHAVYKIFSCFLPL